MPVLSTLGAAIANVYGFTSGLIKDQYFNLVSLLLPGNGTNGAQNNTFLDGSSNNFTITRNGNTTQGTFSPFSQTGWGNYFNGTNAYLSTPSITIGTGDFTVEAWQYILPDGTDYGRVVGIGDFQTSSGLGINFNPSTLKFEINTGNSAIITSSGTFSYNTWYHISLVRSGSTVTLYVNGTSQGSVNNTNSISGVVYISAINYTSVIYYGASYTSNVRITTTAIVPPAGGPTAPLTSVTGTLLLTCQSNRFIDTNTQVAAKTITVNGSPSVVPFSPFAPTQSYSAAAVGGSGYFDGTGDYLSMPTGSFTFGSSDFTIEAWVYNTGTTTGTFFNGQYTSGATTTSIIGAIGSLNGNFDMYIGSSVYSLTGINPALNQWVHLAVVRTGGTVSVFQNGTRTHTRSDLSTLSINTGGTTVAPQIGSSFFGYYAGNRIIIGSGPYDATLTTLTVPTAPFTAITNTKLLLNYTNGGVVDATAKNVLETVGTAQISNGAAKFGTTSIYLNGDGNYLTSRGSPVFSLNGDFTMEAWVYPINAGRSADAEKYGTIVSCSAPGVNSPEFSWFVRIVGSSITEYFLNMNGTTVLQVTGLSVSLNAWHYFAVTRSGTGTGNVKLYVDGNLVGTSSGASTQSPTFSSSQTLMVGRNANSAAYQNWLSGYFQGVRITPGYVRTVTTVPTAPFPVQ